MGIIVIMGGLRIFEGEREEEGARGLCLEVYAKCGKCMILWVEKNIGRRTCAV